MKELKIEDYNLGKIFKEALGFRETYNILKLTINLSNVASIDFLTPMTTSIVFSCELYLKILLIHYNGNLKESHSLKMLFDSLPAETKYNIENTFNMNCSDKKYFKMALELSSNSYTHFRYYFSYDENMDIHLTFFEKFNDILYTQAKSFI